MIYFLESSEESNQEESKQEPKSNSLPEEEKISRDRSLPRGILKNPLQRDFVDLKREFSADAKTYSFNQNMSLRSLTLLKTPVKPKLKKIISQYPITSSGNINSAMLPKSTKLKLNSIARMRRMSTLTMNHQINNSIAQQYDFKDLKSMQKESASITTRSEEHKSGRSLCIFHRKNIVRRIDKKIAEHPYFEYFILVVIIISSITLALENPLNNPDSKLSKSLDIINIIMTSIFWIEFMMKVLANGLIFNGKQSYLRNPWNIIDFFIVIISILSIFTSNDLSFFKVIRVMRLLRPLKVIQRNEGLKVAVQALFMAIPNIFYVSVVAMLFFAIFGMTGVNMFKGKFFSWQGLDDDALSKVINHDEWKDAGGFWENSDTNFDNIIQASMTLFEMSTTEGWIQVMNLGIDSRGIDKQPKENQNRANSIYFILFIIIGSFFILNLFVGVVISTFNLEKENLGKNYLLTNTQKEWINTRFNIVKMKPLKISNLKEKPWFKIINNKYFEVFIIFCIVINTIALALNWYRRPNVVERVTDIVNYIFTVVFTIEAIIKIWGMGWKKYFTDGWNIFDFAIMIGSYLGVIVEYFTSISVGVQTTILRAFRISRMLRLVKRAKRLNIIFETFIVTIPALANIGGLLLLLLYLYSIIGIQLFAPVKHQENLNVHANFETFLRSFLTLFRASTGEGWNDIMHDISRGKGPLFSCIENPSYDDYKEAGKPIGWGSSYGVIYLTSFILFVQLIFLNLFIAIILQGFDFMNKKANMVLHDADLEWFKEEWAKYDPEGKGFIKVEDLNKFLIKIGSPLGFDSITSANLERQKEYISNLDLWTYKRVTYYNFYDVLRKLAKHLIMKITLESKK